MRLIVKNCPTGMAERHAIILSELIQQLLSLEADAEV